MLSILLAILKFIGILLLSILLLFILIITVVLISPLKYGIAGEKKEELNGDFAAQWLFGLIRIKGNFVYGKEPEITVKVLWFTLFGQKKKKEVRKRKAKPLPQRMKTGSPVVAREKATKTPSQGVYMAEPTPPKVEVSKQMETEKVQPVVQEPKEEPLPPKPKVRRVKVSEIQEQPIDIVTAEKEPENFFTGEDETEDEKDSNLDKLRFYWHKFQEIEDKRGIFLAAKTLLKRLIKGILPNHLFIKATLGLGNPTYTGYLMGLIGILTAKFGNNIQVKGDFTRLVAEDIEVKIKGKIVMGSFLYALLAFGLTKPVRRILIKLWKGRKQNG
ncbi:hypothetical protein [Anaerotignum sp. MB30-C6]|uniref:hypothetical protein n=1 Tax=Anaerotignum sp. MB30-C6 TaxID=3070814 RepID=UPI0027DBF1EE|nr:hypothetical protein [Anaerotignum sp. MB30-C6]WMI81344.1 hypothetical protein RBQ60_01030 [Anaerotignum sp. MB30-C6]